MPPLPVYPAVPWIQIESLSLPYGSPNLPDNTNNSAQDSNRSCATRPKHISGNFGFGEWDFGCLMLFCNFIGGALLKTNFC